MVRSLKRKVAAVLFLAPCSAHLEQSEPTQQFNDVLLNRILKSLKTEELTHRSEEWNLSSALVSGIPAIS